MIPEKRNAARYILEVAAEVHTTGGVVPASTRNLSETGVCLDLKEELAEDSSMELSLFLVEEGIEDPDEEQVSAKARVIWCTERDDSGFSAGIRFEHLDDDNKGRISNFLKRLSE